MRLQYSVAFVLLVSVFGALFFVEQVSGWLFFFIVEAILIFLGVELLHLRMPQQLREARSDNCLRMDGSFSKHRHRKEQLALNHVRRDLLAVFLVIVLSGNWLAFFVHYVVVPVPIALKAVEAFDLDSQTWKANLRAGRVDEAFADWSTSRAPGDHAAIRSQQELLWSTWPVIILVFIGWGLVCAFFISRAYLKIIRDYASGVATRAEQNINLDITRLQESHRS